MSDPVIVVTRRWPAEVERELLRRYPNTRLNTEDVPLSQEDLRRALHEADAVLPTVSDRMPAELFDESVRTQFIGNLGVGYNHVDVDAAASAGIVVTNTPGVLTDATADIALTLMLMVTRRAGEGEREVRAGRWTGWRPTHLLGTGLTGKTLGVIGMGRIGIETARRAQAAFRMPVVYYTHGADPGHGVPEARRCDSIDEVMASADVVSLHIPGRPENNGVIDRARIGLLKPSAYLVNTARGDVLDQDALIEALAGGRIAGAGLDVYPGEPEVPVALRELENVVLLPHLGSNTIETRTAMGMLVLTNLTAFLDGDQPPNRVA